MTATRVSLAKLTPPRLHATVQREKLFALLDEQSRRPALWITGPPGAGKTTLVASYLAARSLAGIWYQVDDGDADPASFFYYLGQAAHKAMPHQRKPLPLLTPEYLTDLPGFARRYFRELFRRLPAPAIMVLDNYHEVDLEFALHQIVQEAIAEAPEGARIIVASRAEPPPHAAHHLANNLIGHLGWDELRLTADETAAIALTAGPLDSEMARVLYARSDGWVAGLVLILERLRRVGTVQDLGQSEATETVFNYFAGEVFDQASPEIRLFLMRTAFAPQITVTMAEELTGNALAGKLLDELYRRQWFTERRPGVDSIFRYHDLFREFLLGRARTSFSAAQVATIQRLAAKLMEQSGETEAAVSLYRAAEDWGELNRVVTGAAPALIATGRHQTLTQWLDNIPHATFERSPWLWYWRGRARLPFDPAEARGLFERAYLGFQEYDDAVGLYSAWSGVMDTFFFEWRDFKPVDRWIVEFERLRVRHPDFPSRDVELRTYWSMGTLLHRRPDHPSLRAWVERGLALLDADRDRDLSVLVGGYLIVGLLWWGDTVKARGVIDRLVSWADLPDTSPVVFILWSCAVALYHSVQGETVACRRPVEAALGLAERTGLHAFDSLLHAQMARCCLIAGDLPGAEAWMSAMASTMRSHTHIQGSFYQHLKSNLAAQRGNWQQAVEHGRTGLAMAIEAGTPFPEAHCRIDLARALLGSGDHAEWTQHLVAAHTIGQAMNSRVLDYLCLETEATAALRQRNESLALARLAQALAVSRAMDGATWLLHGPRASAELYDRALAAGIEVDHVQRLIRRRRLTAPNPAAAAESWPWPVRIYALGRSALVVEDEPLVFHGKAQRKPLELLGAVVASAEKGVSSGALMAQLWPELDGDATRNAFDLALHRLRKLLRWDDALIVQEGRLRLNETQVWVDVWAFERMCGVVERLKAEQTGKKNEGIGPLAQRLLGLYPGHFLPHEEAPWALAARQRLHSKFVRGVSTLGRLLEGNAALEEATALYRRGIELDPLTEEFHLRLMQSYHAQGRIAEALDAYRRCRDLLSITLGVQPSAATQAAYRALTS